MRRNIFMEDGTRADRLAALAAARKRFSPLVDGLLGEASDIAVERWRVVRSAFVFDEAEDLVRRAREGSGELGRLLDKVDRSALRNLSHLAEFAKIIGEPTYSACAWLEEELER